MVERYEYEHFHESWIAIEDGEWVKYEDYAKLEAEVEKLRDALEYCSEKLMKGILGYEPQAMMLERIEQALEDE